jgi:hypothetical protein
MFDTLSENCIFYISPIFTLAVSNPTFMSCPLRGRSSTETGIHRGLAMSRKCHVCGSIDNYVTPATIAAANSNEKLPVPSAAQIGMGDSTYTAERAARKARADAEAAADQATSA